MTPRTNVQHLFVYGSLAPGRPNAHVLADVEGTWQPARVHGTLHAEGWGASMGFPALLPHAGGEAVEGLVFSSSALDTEWARLDAFEGEGYARREVDAVLDDGTCIRAQAYTLAAFENSADSR